MEQINNVAAYRIRVFKAVFQCNDKTFVQTRLSHCKPQTYSHTDSHLLRCAHPMLKISDTVSNVVDQGAHVVARSEVVWNLVLVLVDG